MRFFLSLLLFCGSLGLAGCVATSKYVDKSDALSYDLFDHILKEDQAAQPVLRELKQHIDEGSSPKINPEVAASLADGILPGAGLAITTLMGMYARRKQNEVKYVTEQSIKVAKEKDPEKALRQLADDDKIKGYNGRG